MSCVHESSDALTTMKRFVLAMGSIICDKSGADLEQILMQALLPICCMS